MLLENHYQHNSNLHEEGQRKSHAKLFRIALALNFHGLNSALFDDKTEG